MKGPFNRSESNRDMYYYSTWYCTDNGQPVRKPLPYRQSAGTCTRSPDTPAHLIDAVNTDVSYWTQQWGRDSQMLQSVCYDSYRRLVGQLGPAVQMGINLSQIGPTARLFKGLGGAVVHPLRTIGTLMKNFAKRNGGRKLLLKEVPDAYLAFQFGLLPVMQDLYSAVEIWQSPELFQVPLKAHAARTYSYSSRNGIRDWSYDETYKVACKRACIVSVQNSNLASLQQWGLLNPASVAWDLVPFSFVVNWFLPIGTWLSSFTDFAGLEVTDAYRTRFVQGVGIQIYRNPPHLPPDWAWSTRARKWERSLGINTPDFPTSVNLSLGAGQIVTSGALLLQQLKLWRI